MSPANTKARRMTYAAQRKYDRMGEANARTVDAIVVKVWLKLQSLIATTEFPNGRFQQRLRSILYDDVMAKLIVTIRGQLEEAAKLGWTTGVEVHTTCVPREVWVKWARWKSGLQEAFDPNQPRDEDGKWTDTGASSGHSYAALAMPHDMTGKVDIVDAATGEILATADADAVRQMLADTKAEGGSIHDLRVRHHDAHAAAKQELNRLAAIDALDKKNKAEAEKNRLGNRPGGKDWVQPPEKIYHATYADDAILKTGFRTADQLGPVADVLGGSNRGAVSFTTLDNARLYRDGLAVARDAAQGRVNPDSPAQLVAIGKRFGVAARKMEEIAARHTQGSHPDRMFRILQDVSFEGRKFPLFMGSKWTHTVLTAKAPSILEIPSSGPEIITYHKSESEWKIGDPHKIKSVRKLESVQGFDYAGNIQESLREVAGARRLAFWPHSRGANATEGTHDGTSQEWPSDSRNVGPSGRGQRTNGQPNADVSGVTLQEMMMFRWAAKAISLVVDFAELIAGKELDEANWLKRLEKIVFPPPTKQEVETILRSDRWPDRKTWPQRLQREGLSFDSIVNQVSTSMAQGKNVKEITKDIEPLVNNVRVRARRIARTESIRVAQTMQRETDKHVDDLVYGRQILSVGDERVRPEHKERHGRIYYKPGWGPAGAPEFGECPEVPDAPNCRCATYVLYKGIDQIGLEHLRFSPDFMPANVRQQSAAP